MPVQTCRINYQLWIRTGLSKKNFPYFANLKASKKYLFCLRMKPSSEKEQRENRLIEKTFQMPQAHNVYVYTFLLMNSIVYLYQLPRRNLIAVTPEAVR